MSRQRKNSKWVAGQCRSCKLKKSIRAKFFSPEYAKLMAPRCEACGGEIVKVGWGKKKKRRRGRRPKKNTSPTHALQSFRRKGYDEYLKSPYWKNLRRRLISDPDICMGCLKEFPRQRLQLHHLNYAAMGLETTCDLARICRDCHGQLHEHLDKLYPGMSTAGKASRTESVWATFFGLSLKQAAQAHPWKRTQRKDRAQIAHIRHCA